MPDDYSFVAQLLHPVRFLQMICFVQLLLKYCPRLGSPGEENLAMALNALSAFLYGISNFWLLLVYNTLFSLVDLR